MQIMVRIPTAEEDSITSQSGGENTSDQNQRRLKELDDWAIIEMQGDLESRIGDIQLEGKFVGDLHFTKSGQVPVLIIGHHILHGKVVKLEKPLIIMEKTQKEAVEESTTEYKVRAIIRRKIVFKTRPKPIIANVPKKI